MSYGVIPIKQPSSGFTQSGVTAYLSGQDLLSVLLFQTAGALSVAPGGTNSFERLFVVGTGDIGSIEDIQNRALAMSTGTVRGRVTVAGPAGRRRRRGGGENAGRMARRSTSSIRCAPTPTGSTRARSRPAITS